MPTSSANGPAPRRATRWLWFACGWLAVGIGSIGILIPGLPTTVFFIIAASCFAKSSPRFEQWVLNLPRIGPLVRDYRAGLGMPRRTKAWAIGTMVVFASLGILLAVDDFVVIAVIAGLVAIGAAYVAFRVPTREVVLAQRGPTPD